METTRFILLVALGLVLTMIYQSWHEDYNDLSTQAEINKQELVLESTEGTRVGDLPTVSTSTSKSMNQKLSVDRKSQRLQSGEVIHVKTDLLELEINTLGGTIQHLELLNYPVSKKQKTGNCFKDMFM